MADSLSQQRRGLRRLTRVLRGAALLVILTTTLWGCQRAQETALGPTSEGCRSCHGSLANAAPPKALDGTLDPSSRSVGAHQVHLMGGALERPVGCEECHLVPATPGAEGHVDSELPAEVTFGVVATSSHTQPRWSPDTLTCAETYCHGAKLTGGSNTEPKWTQVDGTQAACGTCHGLPPPAPHPASRACEDCHAPVAGAGLTLARPVRHADGHLDVVGGAGCSSCHGSDANAAPPSALNRRADTAALSVGAHQTHLTGGSRSRPATCGDCHLVPATLDAPGHVDTSTPAEVIFGPVARASGARPTWNRSQATCAQSHCHGATAASGGTRTEPKWTTVDGTQATCGSCHGLPPPAPHPADDQCQLCHLPTAGPRLSIANRSTHVDGKLDVAIDGCLGCHGARDSLAPPPDSQGQADASRTSVGAHRIHLFGGRGSLPVACDACHLVPTTLDAPGHRDTGAPAELRFSGLAVAAGARPVWDGAAATCQSTYCHGTTLTGGTQLSPVWTKVDGSQTECGACHGMPPPGPHPQNEACEQCHSPTAGPGQKVANPATHVDGILQAQTDECTSCHGDKTQSAPPFDTTGSAVLTRSGNGAHRNHLEARASLSRPVACTECHVEPADRDAPGHRDTPLPAELTFGPLATAEGLRPDYDPAQGTCGDTYCHGASLEGGADTRPKWTLLDGQQVRCGSCHGAPPGGTHPADDRCERCHLPTAGPGQTIADPATHLDGILQSQVDCDSCHGENGTSAPPKDLDGQTVTTRVTVGAHRQHLDGGLVSRAVSCAECHLVPDDVDSPGHRDTPRPAEVIFGAIATQGHAPRWSAPTCSNSYCHAQLGAASPSPAWDRVDGTQVTCEGCHGMPPLTPVHSRQTECNGCHLPTAGPGRAIADRSTHVDGVVQVTDTSCGSCHGSGANDAPPRDLAGNADPSSVTVGAHQTHLLGGNSSLPIPCATCHLVPATLDAAGHVDSPAPAEVIFTGIARADRAAPSWDRTAATCGNVYCHGATLEGSTPAPPTWTRVDGTQAACGTCHGLPPAAPHPSNDRCELCHLPTAGPGKTIASRVTHVDGIVQVALDGCTGCHGTTANLAPPTDVAGHNETTRVSVGAHQSHLRGGVIAAPIACDTCHQVPAAVDSPGHRDTASPAEVRMTGIVAAAVWDAGAASCRTTYCHGSTLSGGTRTVPVWTTVDGTQAACGACHGVPPPAPHPGNPSCEQCHSPTAGPNQTIASLTTHVDGVLQVSGTACDSCHGSGGSSAPPLDTTGASTPMARGVGAHRKHLEATTGLSRPVACTECHLVPVDLDAPGHRDTALPAELTFGPLATTGGAAPAFDGSALSCAGTYCHGATLSDGTITAPVWTNSDGTQATCGSCHGAPPAGTHPSDPQCEHCHLPTAGPGQTIASAATHIDGQLQVQVACDSCHGSAGVSAPPLDLDRQAATTRATVGAHRSHLGGGAASRPVACSECHVVPATADSPGHMDTARPAEVVFGPLAAQGASPRWTSPTCGNTYCHSGNGAGHATPRWTLVDGSQSTCGSCHGDPPPTPAHVSAADCSACHLPTAGPGHSIADRSTHVDGILQVTEPGCGTCHGDADSPAPPRDLDSHNAATDPEVGTHRAHLAGGSSSAAVPCASCHRVPLRSEDPGHMDTTRPAELIFSGLSSGIAGAPVWDPTGRTCANTYCHGADSSLGSNETPTWNQPGSAGCGSCHGLPPAGPHPQSDKCELCHAEVAGANRTITDRTKHVDGRVQVANRATCASCHGTDASGTPPPDLAGATTSAKVGAHAAHMTGTGRSKPTTCGDCHVPVPVNNMDQAGHYDTSPPAEVVFGSLASADGLRPALQAGACQSTYCHGASLTGGVATAPAWTGRALACNACHGMPPPDSVHGNGSAVQCQACHPDTAGPSQTIINAAKHVDGVVDTAATCDACHGGNGDPTPPKDLAGLTSGPKVGAHLSHRQPANASVVTCETCHQVPVDYGDPGHADTAAPAEVSLRGRAALDGAQPSYSPATMSCGGTYCHGSTLAGGATSVRFDDTSGAPAACGGCHGMPPATPAHNGQGPDSCQGCHQDDAGPAQTIIEPTLHVDGTLQVSGGGCDTCHGSPPAPGRESYAGSAGAHAAHAGRLGFACSMCHGNDGSGPEHNQGNGAVSRANVQIRFDSAVAYPGGTTMRNGQPNATYDRASARCQVGCHNPIVNQPNEAPALTNAVAWSGGRPGCLGCHDQIASASPRSHDLTGLGDGGCATCHDPAGHTAGTARLKDPDTTDTFAPSSVDGLCKTCHDGAGGTAFGGKPARNVSTLWTSSSHGGQGYMCTRCHTYHSAKTGGPLFLDPASTTCLAAGCHATLATTDFNQVPGGPVSHHRIEGGTGISLSCVSCHNPHLDKAHPLAAVDPDNRWASYSLPDAARTQKTSGGNYNGYCLKCHDGTPPPGVLGAKNIAQARAGGADTSGFVENGNTTKSWHKSEHSGFNCMNCHDPHASDGTAGINRGKLLYRWITVNNTTYTSEGSCGTRPPAGSGFSCH